MRVILFYVIVKKCKKYFWFVPYGSQPYGLTKPSIYHFSSAELRAAFSSAPRPALAPLPARMSSS